MWEKRNLLFRNLRGGVRDGYPDCRDIPCGAVDVCDGVSVDCLRLRLLSAAVRQCGSAWRTERERSGNMNIVVWKAPKSLHGILRRLFGMKKPKEA